MYVQGIDEPLETYFWPAELIYVEEEEEEKESEDEKQYENGSKAEGDESADVSGRFTTIIVLYTFFFLVHVYISWPNNLKL